MLVYGCKEGVKTGDRVELIVVLCSVPVVVAFSFHIFARILGNIELRGENIVEEGGNL